MESLPLKKPRSLDDWLAEKRASLPARLSPEEAAQEMQQGAKLIDVRTLEQQKVDGVIPGSIAIGLNVLEWRCHPSSADRDPRIPQGFGQRLIILCNQGYSSSVAANHLQELGLKNTTDVVGGFTAWKEAGLPWNVYSEG